MRTFETIHGQTSGTGTVSRETRTARTGQIDSGEQIRWKNEPVLGPWGWSVERDGVWSVHEPGVLLAEGKAGDLATRIICERKIDDVELQFDFEYRGNDGFRLGFFESTNGTVDEPVESPASSDGDREVQQGMGLDIVPNISGSGGLIDLATGECLQPCDSLGQLMLKSNGWNAFRATLVGGRVTAWLNGWKLIEYSGKGPPTTDRRIAFELIATGSQRLALRNVRVHEQGAAELEEVLIE